jgi:hypothetical protein
MFRVEGTHIMNEGKNNKKTAVSVQSNTDNENRHITVNENPDNRIAQQWEVVYADEWKGEPGKGELNEEYGLYIERPFYIVSAMGSGRYLDLINNRNMVIKTPNGRKTQIWWFDQRSYTIKTKLNNQSFDIQSSGKTNNMQVWSTNSQWFQIFKYQGNMFINVGKDGKVLDVSGSRDVEGQAVQVHGNNGGKNQKWNVVYLDKAPKVKNTGMNEEFGFFMNRPFYLQSRLPMRRVAECVGANNVVIRRYVTKRVS